MSEYENDPTSIYYKRVHTRKKINVVYFLLNLILSIIYFFLIYKLIPKPKGIILILAIVVYIAFELKYFVTTSIKLYQWFAPVHIRDRCRFEPSCSNFALLAIEKYGIIKGGIKAIDRLRRCNINNGGFDEP